MSFQMSDIYRRSLIFVVLQRTGGYEKSIGERFKTILKPLKFNLVYLVLGAAEIYFGKFKFDQGYSGWYPLFPAYTMGIESTSFSP